MLAFEFSSKKTSIGLFGFQALLFFTMIPVVALIAHNGAVGRTMLLAALKPGSIMARYLSGTLLRTLFASCIAGLMCVVLVMQMMLPDTRGSIFSVLIGQAIFVVLLLPAILRWTKKHFQPWSQVNVVQHFVVFTCGMFGALVMVIILPLPSVMGLEQALKTTPFPNAPLLDLLAMSQSLVEGLQRMALVETSEIGWRSNFAANFCYFLLSLPSFLMSACIFVALGVRASEMKRAFAAPRASDSPAPISSGAVVAALMAATLFWCLHHYIWLPLDVFIGSKQFPQKVRVTYDVIRLGGRDYEASTFDLIKRTRPDMSTFTKGARDRMCETAAQAFRGARVKSLNYVDYYYSMPAAIMRTGLVFSDRPDDAMREEVQNRIFDSSFQKLLTAGAASVQQTELIAKEINLQWQKNAKIILAEREVVASEGTKLKVVAEASDFGKLMGPPSEILDARWKGATAIASALLSKGGIDMFANKASRAISNAPAIKSFASRLAAKAQLDSKTNNLLQTTAKVATKSATGILGAATGILGAAAGTAAGALVTKGLLEVDEALYRKEFEEQILREVDRTETEFRNKAQCSAKADN